MRPRKIAIEVRDVPREPTVIVLTTASSAATRSPPIPQSSRLSKVGRKLYDSSLRDAFAEIKATTERYRHFAELQPLWNAVDRLEKSINKAVAKRP